MTNGRPHVVQVFVWWVTGFGFICAGIWAVFIYFNQTNDVKVVEVVVVQDVGPDDWNANRKWIKAKQHLEYVFVDPTHFSSYQSSKKNVKTAMNSAIDAQRKNPDAVRKIRAFGHERTDRFVDCWNRPSCKISIVLE